MRTEAARLRARLSEYYVAEGKYNRLVIELPKGGYVLLLRPVVPAVETETPNPEPSAKPRLRQVWLAAAIACLIAGLLVAVPPECADSHRRPALSWPEPRSSQRRLCRRPDRRDHPQPVHYRRTGGALPRIEEAIQFFTAHPIRQILAPFWAAPWDAQVAATRLRNWRPAPQTRSHRL